MGWKTYIPGYGEKKVTKRIRELERQAGTLPVIFGLLLFEAIKGTVAGIPFPVPDPAKFIIMAIVVASVYVYDDERRKAVESAKKKAQDAKDKATGEE